MTIKGENNMAYLVLAYPEIKANDYGLIQYYRKNYDELYYNVVEPHFTLVFPVFDNIKEEFIHEIIEKSKDFHQFDFVIRCATINKDAFNDYYHAFMVPDEGYSNIMKMHDKLYSGSLKDKQRLDIDFVPHIGIANSKDKFRCKRIVEEWNEKDFAINGTISHLTIANYHHERVTNLQKIKLRPKKYPL